MKPLLTALTLLILVTVPAYAEEDQVWKYGKFLCKPMVFADGSGNEEPFIAHVMEDRLVFDFLEETSEAILMSPLHSEKDGTVNPDTEPYYVEGKIYYERVPNGFDVIVALQGGYAGTDTYADLILERQSWYGRIHLDEKTTCRLTQ